MAALTADRAVQSKTGILFSYPVLTNVKIFQGAIVAITSAGYARPGITATGLTVVGIARESVDSTGIASGNLTVEVEEMIAGCASAGAGDLITFDDIGKFCFLVDDQTVGLTDGTGTRSRAGIISSVEGALVFVKFSNSIAALSSLA